MQIQVFCHRAIRRLLERITLPFLCVLFLLCASCSPKGKDAVIGIWQGTENTVWRAIEFRQDGRFLFQDAFGTKSVAYTWQEDNQIVFKFERFGTNDTTIVEPLSFGVVANRNTLALSNRSEWGKNDVRTYHRISSAEANQLDIDDFKGQQLVPLPATASLEEVVAALFAKSNLLGGKVTAYKILQKQQVFGSRGAPFFVDVDTNLGKRGIYIEYDRPEIGVGSLRGWWCRLDKTGL